jgi:ABC-type uncharacterized transport system ATPase subunit
MSNMPTIQEIEQLKKQVEALKEGVAIKKGRLLELKKSYKGSLELRARIEQIEAERVELEKQYQKLLTEYKRAYRDCFGAKPPA